MSLDCDSRLDSYASRVRKCSPLRAIINSNYGTMDGKKDDASFVEKSDGVTIKPIETNLHGKHYTLLRQLVFAKTAFL